MGAKEDLDLARALINSGIAGELGLDLDDLGGDVGDVDILGALGVDDDMGEVDIIGAMSPLKSLSVQQKKAVAGLVKRQGMQLARKAVANKQPRAVSRDDEGDVWTRYLPVHRDAAIGGGLIVAGADADIVSEPQSPFKPSALVIDDESIPDFLVMALFIGSEPLFISNTGGIPASFFRGDSILNRLNVRTGQTAQQFTTRVRNRSADSRAFYAGYVGLGKR